MSMNETLFNVPALDRTLTAALQRKIDRKTKPLGALGQIETMAMQIGLIQRTLTPQFKQPHFVVFAGDHGATRLGISSASQEVTWQMVENFLAGGAGINVFVRQNGLGITIVDAGVAHDFGLRPGLVDAKIAAGTRNYVDEPAMTAAQCALAMQRGAHIVASLAAAGSNVIGFGEMGIGNSSSASLITHCLTCAPLDECIGRGAGLGEAGLQRKRRLLAQALARAGQPRAPLTVLAEFGGFEIAMMAGAMLGAAQAGVLLLIDGFIAGSAALVASRLAPHFAEYCIFCHHSVEPGHRIQLAAMNADPLIDLRLRLGEGTGAALAYPLVLAAVNFLNEMASFESAGVSDH